MPKLPSRDQLSDNREEPAKKRTYLLDAKSYNETTGSEFGGSADVVQIEPGEAAGPFAYIGLEQITTDLGPAISHRCFAPDKTQVRMPLQATFVKAVEQAALRGGDTFILFRGDDQIKKRGAGKGKPMAIYSIKVTDRKPVQAPATF